MQKCRIFKGDFGDYAWNLAIVIVARFCGILRKIAIISSLRICPAFVGIYKIIKTASLPSLRDSTIAESWHCMETQNASFSSLRDLTKSRRGNPASFSSLRSILKKCCGNPKILFRVARFCRIAGIFKRFCSFYIFTPPRFY